MRKKAMKLFSIKMDDITRKQIEELSEMYDGNMSLLLRMLVRREYNDRFILTEQGRTALEEQQKK